MKRKSTAFSRAVKRRKGVPKYRVQDRTSGIAPVKIKNSKAVKTKVVGKVKVSAGLRAKIKKVISNKQFANGSYTDHFIGGGFMMGSRQQVVTSSASFGQPTSWHFTIPMFLDVASQLFNGKQPGTSGSNRYQLSSTNMLSPKNLTFDVKNSYSTYTIKNGSQHAAHVIMVVAVPKRKGSCLEWGTSLSAQNQAGGILTCSDAITDAATTWTNGLAQDSVNGMILDSFQPDKTSLTGAGSYQPPRISDLFRMPSSCRTFNNLFKVEYVKFFLQPGQVVTHTLQGPKAIEIDMAKSYANATLINIQKYSRNVSFIGYNSPNALSTFNPTGTDLKDAVPGRWADQIDNLDAGFSIFVERSDHYSLSIPDQIGFTYPATFTGSSTQNLDRRVSRELNHVWDVPGIPVAVTVPPSLKTVVDLSVMNPQAPVTSTAQAPAA